jgi:flagellar assembly protein FliH
MSTKLHRGGGPPSEPVAWQRVSPLDAIAGDGQTPSGHTVFPPSSGGAKRPAVDTEQSIRQAHQQGYDEGLAAGRQAVAGQIEAMQTKLARTIEEITGLRPRYRHEAEQDTVGLALAVARRILHRELTVSPDALLGLVKAALAKMDAREVNQVRVSRQDAPMVLAFFEKMGVPHRIEVVADPGLAPGSVVLESERGTLDASVGTQLDEIERGFADLVRRTQ